MNKHLPFAPLALAFTSGTAVSQRCSQSPNCSSFIENQASLKTWPQILPNPSSRCEVAESTSAEKDLLTLLKLLPALFSGSFFFVEENLSSC